MNSTRPRVLSGLIGFYIPASIIRLTTDLFLKPIGDKDPLDVLVLGQETFVPLSLAYAKPIGVMRMLDQGEADDKIIAVHAHDPEFNHFNSIKELSPHRIKEIRRFFEDYKILENKKVTVEDFYDRDIALEILKEAVDLYRKHESELRA